MLLLAGIFVIDDLGGISVIVPMATMDWSMLLDQSSVASTHRFLYYSYIEPTYRLHQIALSITQLAFSQSPQYIYLRKAYEKGKLLYAGCVQL